MPNLKDLERQSGLLRLLLYLLRGDSHVVKLPRDYDIPSNQLMRSINQLIKLGLIASNIDKSSFPNKKILSLTEKGTKIAMKLKEVEKVLND